MKKGLLVILVFLSVQGSAQVNLVPNPSFEDTVACPTTLDQINYSVNWQSFGISPDYYNDCNQNGLSTPSNGVGFQYAASGNAYAGIVAYDVNGFAREIIGCQLTQQLVIGQKYYISLKGSLADYTPQFPQFLASSGLGVNFSTVAYSASNIAPINNYAAVYSSAIISDTLNWVSISGTFIADSTYSYLMIGNFFDDLNTDTLNRPNGIRSYFFIDDVCVSTDSMACATVGVSEPPALQAFHIWPNPACEQLNITTSTNYIRYRIVNSLGQILLESTSVTASGIHSISTELCSSGLYYVEIITENSISSTKFLICKP